MSRNNKTKTDWPDRTFTTCPSSVVAAVRSIRWFVFRRPLPEMYRSIIGRDGCQVFHLSTPGDEYTPDW